MQEIVRMTNFYRDNAILMERYSENKGIALYYYNFIDNDELDSLDLVKIDKYLTDDECECGYCQAYTKDFGDKLSYEEFKEMNGNDYNLGIIYDYVSNNYVNRDEPALVKTVKELKQKLNEEEFPIEVVVIPDGVEWYISRNDFGYERIVECHREW